VAEEEELETFLKERLSEFDPSISTASGSRADRIIIQPTVARFGTTPFDVDIVSFLKDRIKQEFPSLDVNLTDLEDLIIKPQAVLLDPLRREIRAIQIQQSIENPSLLLEDEADALMANIFVSRIQGNRARGLARLYFNGPVSFIGLPSMTLTTASGLKFHPTQVQSITVNEMQANTEDGFFFLDITVEAELEGTESQIEPGALIRVDNAPGVVRVTNKARFSGGLDRQTNQELKDFAELSITERSLTTTRGVSSQLLANFTVEDVLTVGYGDPEMERDIIESVGPLVASQTADITVSVVGLVVTDSTPPSGSFLTADVRVGDKITFFTGPNFGRTYPITAVTGTTVTLSGAITAHASGIPITYFITQETEATLTISAIPGGILSVPPISVANSTVHIGNHTDAYVKVPKLDQDFVDIISLPDPADDKDLLDATHIDIDLISYTKFSGIGVTTSGTDAMTTTDDLRKFGLVVNDIIRFIQDQAPQDLVDLGPLRVASIDDTDPLVLHLEDLLGTSLASLPHSTSNTAAYNLLSTEAAIQQDQLPLVRVTAIDLMTSDTPPKPFSGVTIPYKNPVDIRSTDFFSPGAAVSTGKFRVYFLEPTTAQFDAGTTGSILGTVFKVTSGGSTLYYRPDGSVFLGDLGTGVRKARDPALAAAPAKDSGVATGDLTAEDTFELSAGTFVGGTQEGDLIVATGTGGLVIGNFYITEVISTTEVKVVPDQDFTGAIPTTGLDWTLIDRDDLTAQRISSKDMARNLEGSLFYVDIAAVSYDHNTNGDPATDPPSARTLPDDAEDDVFNISDGSIATVTGQRSLGYFFKQNTTPGSLRDSSLAFSVHERLILSFTDNFMQTSVSDPILTIGFAGAYATTNPGNPVNNNSTTLESKNVRVNFEKAPEIQRIQTFVDSGTGRVVTENILVKHMIPAFVDLTIEYEAGLSTSTAEAFLSELIDETDSDQDLSASDIDNLLRQRIEAEDVTFPLGLVAVVHNANRIVTVDRSENELFVSRTSHFFPGNITLTRVG
jgi:hypothetical protein